MTNNRNIGQAISVNVVDLSKSFGSEKVLKNINFNVTPGEIFVIMGPSGAGKSIMLKHIIGLLRPDTGKVLLNEMDVIERKTVEQNVIAMVFQEGALFNSLNVFDNLALYLREHRRYNKNNIRTKVTHALEMLSLGNAIDKFPPELSGGMRKRVAIARALVMEPQLLLYDEPTSELDPTMGATISEIIATVRNETQVTSIVVSHDRDLALTISDRVALMMAGEIIEINTPENLTKSKDPRVQSFLNPKINIDQPRFRQKEENK